MREFSIGAVVQHFTKTLNRQPGIMPGMGDFRLPTDPELDAIEAFLLSLGRQQDPDLSTLMLKGEVPARGLEIFLNDNPSAGVAGSCNVCHVNAGANSFQGFNDNFDTGVEALPDQPADLTDEKNPPDGGFGTRFNPATGGFGDRTFNTPPLVEAADTSPFFHNNSIETIEEAVNFYNSLAFNSSRATGFVGQIQLEATQVVAVAAFLRVINALENIRSASDLETRALNTQSQSEANGLLDLSIAELEDAVEVLRGGGLHPEAVEHLRNAIAFDKEAQKQKRAVKRNKSIEQAIAEKEAAGAEIHIPTSFIVGIDHCG